MLTVATQAQRCLALGGPTTRIDAAVLDRPTAPSSPEMPDDLTSISLVRLLLFLCLVHDPKAQRKPHYCISAFSIKPFQVIGIVMRAGTLPVD